MTGRPNRPGHFQDVDIKLNFSEAYELAQKYPSKVYKTKGYSVEFKMIAAVTTRGKHKGERVIRFLSNSSERARSYECCWEHRTNCNRTFIECYTTVIG